MSKLTERLQLLECILDIIVSLIAIGGLIVTLKSDFAHKVKDIVEHTHSKCVQEVLKDAND